MEPKPKGEYYGTCSKCGEDLEIFALAMEPPHLYKPCKHCKEPQK